jgi:L-gulonolactone oxidase
MWFNEVATLASWGRVVQSPHRIARPHFRADLADILAEAASEDGKALAVGLGRSYGDSGLNPHGKAVAMRGLDRVHFFDRTAGILRADAGLSLDALIRIVLPHGLFPPVVPGTRFVTLGGAVANDIHGKNHFNMGSFGRHVRRLSLLRTDGTRHELDTQDVSGLFAATIGGLGLTGVIEWVEIALKDVPGSFLDAEDIAFNSLEEFFLIANESDRTHEYTVAWIDCTQSGNLLGRGIFSRARASADPARSLHPADQSLGLPFDFPSFALNRLTLKGFNSAYFQMKRAKARTGKVHYGTFFFPLDAIAQWNRLYGRRGMFQYQCVLPPGTALQGTSELLTQIAKSGEGSFLAVLKTFGHLPSPGLLSFPMEGTTLALDFRNQGAQTLALLERLDSIVLEAGGRLYPAKDGRMSSSMFMAGYPNSSDFIKHVDPGLSSGFWRRVTT